MDKQEIVSSDLQPVTPKMMVVQGVVQNLPEIIGAIKEIYRLNKKGEAFSQVLQSRLDELNINKENFNVLVVSLTELSKTQDADEVTKKMYRDMIKTLFETFTSNMRSSHDVSNFLNVF
jgi:hypothetical protein